MIRRKENFFTTSDGAKIYFEDYGEGQPIVLVPGYLCTSRFFSRNIEGLSKNNRLILLDVRGHGSSSKPVHGLTIPHCAQDVKELLDFLGVEDAFLIGWSLGSSVVLSYWEQFGKHRIAALGIVDSALYPFSPEDWNSHSLKGYNLDGMNAAMNKSVTDHNGYCRAFASVIWKDVPTAEDVDWVTTEMTKTPPWIAFAIYSDFLHRDYVSVLPSVTVPLMVVGADSMAIPTGIKMAKSYMEHIKAPAELHLFEESGHMLFYTETEKFNELVKGFFARHV